MDFEELGRFVEYSVGVMKSVRLFRGFLFFYSVESRSLWLIVDQISFILPSGGGGSLFCFTCEVISAIIFVELSVSSCLFGREFLLFD